MSKRLLGWTNWQRNRRHHHRSEILDSIVADIKSQSPEMILLTGDVANIALSEEFQQAAQWVQTLGAPEQVLFVPGNHDTYVAMPWANTLGQLAPYMTGERTPGTNRAATGFDDFPYMRQVGPFRFIGLNTSPSTMPGLATGALGEAQMNRLQSMLQDIEDEAGFTVLMLHHPAVKGVVKRRKALDDGDIFSSVVAKSNVDLVVHGHAHYPYFTQMQSNNGKIPHIGVASASYAGKNENPDSAGYRPAAQYHLYTAEKSGNDFQLKLEVRGFNLKAGKVESLNKIDL